MCEDVLKGARHNDPRVMYVDKERVFNNIYTKGIAPHRWANAIIEMAKQEENNWAYSEWNKNRLCI